LGEDRPRPDREWERGWEGHLRAQRRRLAQLPLAEKLQWLEDAQELLAHMRRSGPGRARAGEDVLRETDAGEGKP
jgi:hypothetical protein